MEDNTRYRILVISIFFVMIIVGMYIGFKFGSKEDLANQQTETVVNKNNDNSNISIYNDKQTQQKKYDIELIYEDHYNLCGETITDRKVIYDVTLEELKNTEMAKEETKKYTIVEEDNDKLIFRRELNGYCPNHFKVCLEGNSVVIYNMIDDTNTKLYDKLEISKDIIRPELISELEKGIRVDSINDLNLLIEDLES